MMKYFDEIGLPLSKPLGINADNNGSIANSVNDRNHRRTEHIDVQHHFVKDRTKNGDIASL